MNNVIVFDHGEPRQRLMSWFLTDSGIGNTRLTSLAAVIEELGDPAVRVVVVNTMAPPDDIEAVVARLRDVSPSLRIVVLHDGGHEAGARIDADACLHDVNDPDALVETVRAAIAGTIPDEEPHEAAEEVAE
jgi:DNA-binding NarL/FixJ family response regulator